MKIPFGPIHKFFCLIVIKFIQIYQYRISPLFGQTCIYNPSCSHYAIQSLEKHGLFYGSFYAVCRILRCHPFAEGGEDPVPHKKK